MLEDLDFSPFNSEALLASLSSLLLSSKLISFSYAGDVQGLCERIGRVFSSKRCLLFLEEAKTGEVEVFEYTSGEGVVKPIASSFSGYRGQALAREFLTLADSSYCLAGAGELTLLLSEQSQKSWREVASQLDCGSLYLSPLDFSEKRGGSRGLLFLAQEVGESGWNKIVRDSLAIVADYLTKLLEVEDCHHQLELLTHFDPRTGFYTKQGFLQILKREVAVANYFQDQGSLLLIGLELAAEHRGTKYGEELFARLVGELKVSLRVVDQIAHLAAEQLAVHMPRISAEESKELVEKFLDDSQKVIDSFKKQDDSAAPANLKIGFCSYLGGVNEETLVAQVQEAHERACRLSGSQLVELSFTGQN